MKNNIKWDKKGPLKLVTHHWGGNYMKGFDIYKKLDTLESTINNLRRIVNTQEPIESYKINVNKALGLVEEIKDAIESQPLSPSEINVIK